MIRRPPRSTQGVSSAASDVYKRQPYGELPFECIIKGDGAYLSIAAASILAKTYRDELMSQWALQFPGYGWETNVGYPTPEHREGIKRLGITPYHRKSFQLLPSQLELFETEVDSDAIQS